MLPFFNVSKPLPNYKIELPSHELVKDSRHVNHELLIARKRAT